MNGFCIAADLLHVIAILILTYKIVQTRSSHSIAGGASILYAVVFSCRYLDLSQFDYYDFQFSSLYLLVFKLYFLLSTGLVLYLIYGKFSKTCDTSNDTYPIHYIFVCAALLTWGTYDARSVLTIDKELFWRFSITLEIFAIVPQLSLIKKQGQMDKTMAYYLMTHGSYRAMYIVSWLYRYQTEQFWEPIAFICGCAQTMIYLHFFVRIYPQLTTEQQDEHPKPVQEITTIDFTNIDLNEKEKNNPSVIYTIA